MPSAARKPASHSSVAAVPRVQEGPLIVKIGHQVEGCVYGLHPLSKRRVKAAHPKSHMVPVVLVGYERREEFESLQASMWPQIVQMLTGLSRAQLRAFGGVELHNWEDGWRRRVV